MLASVFASRFAPPGQALQRFVRRCVLHRFRRRTVREGVAMLLDPAGEHLKNEASSPANFDRA
jgi:hypothetical protein